MLTQVKKDFYGGPKIQKKFILFYLKTYELLYDCWERQPRSYVQLSERQTCFGIMGAQFRAPLKHLGSSQQYRSERFKGGLKSGPIMP